MDHIAILQRRGDDLERAIIGDGAGPLASVVAPYASIWWRYVLPNRIGIGNFATNEYARFAGSHYSALIRLHNALKFKDKIIDLCADYQSGGDDQLELHANTGGFWWSLGSCVDNLGHAISEFPGSTIVDSEGKEAGKNHICDRFQFLAYAYSRRTQQIHSRILPIGAKDDYPLFSYEYLDGKDRTNLPASTDWKDEFSTPQRLAEFYEDRWAEAVKEFTNTWCYLLNLLNGFSKEKKDEQSKRLNEAYPMMDEAGRHPALATPTASAFCDERLARSVPIFPEPPPPPNSGFSMGEKDMF